MFPVLGCSCFVLDIRGSEQLCVEPLFCFKSMKYLAV
jgi:hypothetical protein